MVQAVEHAWVLSWRLAAYWMLCHDQWHSSTSTGWWSSISSSTSQMRGNRTLVQLWSKSTIRISSWWWWSVLCDPDAVAQHWSYMNSNTCLPASSPEVSSTSLGSRLLPFDTARTQLEHRRHISVSWMTVSRLSNFRPTAHVSPVASHLHWSAVATLGFHNMAGSHHWPAELLSCLLCL